MAAFDTTFLTNFTRAHFLPAMENQLYNEHVLLNILKKKGSVKPMTGTSLTWGIVTSEHASTGLTGGYHVMANQPSNPTQICTLSPAKYYGTIAISKDEERMNSGNKEKLADLLTIQSENCYATMENDMVTDIYGSATSRGDFNTLVGLAAICNIDRSYAGLDSTTYTVWDGNIDSNAHTIANLKDAGSTSYISTIMATQFTAASWNKGVPDVLVSDAATWNLYQDIIGFTNLRMDNSVADIGFEAVKYRGGASYVFDKDCTANSLYMLNTKTISFYAYPGANFELAEPGFYVPNGQDAKCGHVIWFGQLVCKSPRSNARLSSVGAS